MTGLCPFDHEAGLTAYTVMLILLALVATVENLMVMIVIGKNKSLQKPSIILLGILAGVDFITGAIVIPMHIVLIQAWVSSQFQMINIFMFIGVVFFSLSTVFAISIDRFLHAWRLDRYQLTIKKLVLGLLLFWCIPVFITVVPQGFLMLGFFLLCLLGMICAYIGMVIALRVHARRAGNNTAQRAVIENEQQAVKTTLIIICTCLMLNIPPVVLIVMGVAGNATEAFCAITVFLLLANSAVNPMIYCLRMPLMRKYVFRLLQSCRGRGNVEEVNVDGSESSHDLAAEDLDATVVDATDGDTQI